MKKENLLTRKILHYTSLMFVLICLNVTSQVVPTKKSEIEKSNYSKSIEDSNLLRSMSSVERIRLGFVLPNGYTRHTMIAFIEGATDGLDMGYDGQPIQEMRTDAFLLQGNTKLVIQAFGEFNVERELPIIITIEEALSGGTQKIQIEDLENFPENREIYLFDKLTGVHHDLKMSPFEVILLSGVYHDRFSIRFMIGEISKQRETVLFVNQVELDQKFNVYVNNNRSEIVIKNIGNFKIEDISLYNVYGKQVDSWTFNCNDDLRLTINSLSGIYILSFKNEDHFYRKKLLIK